jgi:hypothetical protein
MEGQAYRAVGAPGIDSPLPLFTPMCGTSIIEEWLPFKDILYTVSILVFFWKRN